jgi:hypothetical protein
VIEALLEAAREAGCYKVILDCAEANAAFYEKCGLTRKEIQMVRADLSALDAPLAKICRLNIYNDCNSGLPHVQVKYF